MRETLARWVPFSRFGVRAAAWWELPNYECFQGFGASVFYGSGGTETRGNTKECRLTKLPVGSRNYLQAHEVVKILVLDVGVVLPHEAHEITCRLMKLPVGW